MDAELGKLLFDFALKLEDTVAYPVDVQHVLAAIVLAAKDGRLDRGTPLSIDDAGQVAVLTDYVKIVFTQFQGRLGEDDL